MPFWNKETRAHVENYMKITVSLRWLPFIAILSIPALFAQVQVEPKAGTWRT